MSPHNICVCGKNKKCTSPFQLKKNALSGAMSKPYHENTAFTLNIQIPQFLITLTLHVEKDNLKHWDRMANNVDLDQTIPLGTVCSIMTPNVSCNYNIFRK